ncbi:MAG: hypothetical protein AAFO70_05505, partial [Pseudomonadota bacterium]
MGRCFFILFWLVTSIIAPTTAMAQLVPGAAETPAAAPTDTLGRTTPRGAVQGYIDAMAANDEARASQYLNAEPGSFRARVLARELRQVLDRKGRLSATVEIDQRPDGDTSDGLAPNIDIVGQLGTGDDRVPLKLERVERDGAQIWLVAEETLAQVPNLFRDSTASLVERFTPEPLRDLLFLGTPLGDLLAILVLFLASLLAGYVVAWVLVWLASTLWLRTGHGRTAEGFARARLPLGLLLSNGWFKAGAVAIGISVIARDYAFRLVDIGSIIAVVWLFFVLTSVVAKYALQQMSLRQQSSAISVTKLLSRLVNAIALAIGAVLILDILGFDVTTGLAALGIGGIALA